MENKIWKTDTNPVALLQSVGEPIAELDSVVPEVSRGPSSGHPILGKIDGITVRAQRA